MSHRSRHALLSWRTATAPRSQPVSPRRAGHPGVESAPRHRETPPQGRRQAAGVRLSRCTTSPFDLQKREPHLPRAPSHRAIQGEQVEPGRSRRLEDIAVIRIEPTVERHVQCAFQVNRHLPNRHALEVRHQLPGPFGREAPTFDGSNCRVAHLPPDGCRSAKDFRAGCIDQHLLLGLVEEHGENGRRGMAGVRRPWHRVELTGERSYPSARGV